MEELDRRDAREANLHTPAKEVCTSWSCGKHRHTCVVVMQAQVKEKPSPKTAEKSPQKASNSSWSSCMCVIEL